LQHLPIVSAAVKGCSIMFLVVRPAAQTLFVGGGPFDHLISRRNGGIFTVWSCPICNELKGSMNPVDFHKRYCPDVSEEFFEAALAEARRKRICPLVAGRRKKTKRKKKLSLKMEKLTEYYDGVYTTGYSSKDPLKGKPSQFSPGRDLT
jgi:hypothetical protein